MWDSLLTLSALEIVCNRPVKNAAFVRILR